MFDRDCINAARAHAMEAYPHESCGLVVAGVYVPCANVAEHPERDFTIAPAEWVRHAGRGIEAVVHSHTNGIQHPSEADMRGQIDSAVPWGIILTNGEQARDPVWWGEGVPIPPLVGRTFLHGVTDCYSIVRDWWRLERGVVLPDFPRQDEWWNAGGDLYRQNFRKAGFRCYAEGPELGHTPEVGDVILMALKAGCPPHHAGVYIGNGAIIHHLADTPTKTRLSRREPLGPWRKFVTHWLRYEG